jgi:electron transfer flavoprotein-quinone oxidoreductase
VARLPGPSDGAPLRRVVLRRWVLLDGERFSAVEFREASASEQGVTVLRSELTDWSTRAATEAGATIGPSEGQVRATTSSAAPPRETSPRPGIAGEFFSEPLAPSASPDPGEAKEWYSCTRYDLPAERIESRFSLEPGEGAVIAALSAPKNGVGVGGYLRTYRTSLGVGVLVWGSGRLAEREEVAAAEAAFRTHPAIAPFLVGSTPRGSILRPISAPRPDRWGGPGYLRIGRGAGLEATNGMEPRGLAAEVASAEIAADVASSALRSGPRLGDRSSEYRRRLSADPVYQGFRDWSTLGARLKSNGRLWSGWPGFAAGSFERLMTERGAPKQSVRRTLEAVRRERRLSQSTLSRSAWIWWEGW